MRLSDYEFELPEGLIAQESRIPRDSCRLMVLDRATEKVHHCVFRQLPELLRPGDCLVLNETRVLPARLYGRIAGTERAAEILLLRAEATPMTWKALLRPGRRLPVGAVIEAGPDVRITVVQRDRDGRASVRFEGIPEAGFRPYLWSHGEMPTPPYIRRTLLDPEDYQTVYSRIEGSVAAPTAGLHFTGGVFAALAARQIQVVKILLHVGYGTFAPLRAEEVESNRLEEEYFSVTAAAARTINECRRGGGRIIPVGTSATRTLETISDGDGYVGEEEGWSGLFIYPDTALRAVDCL